MDQNELEQYLAAARPEASEDALQRVSHRLRPARRQHTSSLLVSLCLALGIVSTGAGGALAVSGLSSSPTAVKAQYAPVVTAPNSSPNTNTDTNSNNNAGTNSGTSPDNAQSPSLGASSPKTPSGKPTSTSSGSGVNAQEVTPSAPSAAQAARQVSASGSTSGQLPLTGYLAIPTLLLGIGLLAGGLLVRRRTHQST